MPDGHTINAKGIEFYHKVSDKLIEYGVKPILTIYRRDLPQALQDEYGGWESRKIINDFTQFCALLYKEFGQKIKYGVSLNEQNIFISLGYLKKSHPPKVSNYQRFLDANHIASLANDSAIKLFKEMQIPGQIGPSFAYSPTYAKSEKPEDVIVMENAQELDNFFWMDVYGKGEYPQIGLKLLENLGINVDFQEGDKALLKAGICDFMGVNYYQSSAYCDPSNQHETLQVGNASQVSVVSDVETIPTNSLYARTDNDYLDMTDWNWAIDSNSLCVSLRRITSSYNLPILISGNGLGAFDTLTKDEKVHDDYRINFLKEHIIAIEDGCEVIGYCTWVFQDLFSWLNGYAKHYGFVYMDRDEENEKELKRYKKDSFTGTRKLSRVMVLNCKLNQRIN